MSKKSLKIAKNKEKILVLDGKDTKILSALEGNARASIAEISRKTGLKRDSIAYRLGEMEKSGAVRFTFRLDSGKTGLSAQSFLLITLQDFDEKSEKELLDYLGRSTHVSYHAVLSGKNDIIIKADGKSQDELNAFMREMKTKFSGIIREVEVNNIVDEKESPNRALLGQK